jgi:hypothetical protein
MLIVRKYPGAVTSLSTKYPFGIALTPSVWRSSLTSAFPSGMQFTIVAVR